MGGECSTCQFRYFDVNSTGGWNDFYGVLLYLYSKDHVKIEGLDTFSPIEYKF